MKPRILSINSLDIQGKYGLAADVKSAYLNLCDISCAMTSFNSPRIDLFQHAKMIEPVFLQEQLDKIFSTQKIDAIKIGLLPTISHINVIHDFIHSINDVPAIILDPVFIPEFDSMHKVNFTEYLAAYKRKLLHLVDLIIVSIQESEQLIGTTVSDFDSAKHAAQMLITMGSKAIYLKGAQMPSPESIDIFVSNDEIHEFPFIKCAKKPNHYCISLSTAITSHVARGLSIIDACAAGRDFIQSILTNSEDDSEVDF